MADDAADTTMTEATEAKAKPPAPPTPSGRASSRDRKKVEHFKPVEKVEKEGEDRGPKGKGTALGDCDNSTSLVAPLIVF
jgi:hypothetical protein